MGESSLRFPDSEKYIRGVVLLSGVVMMVRVEGRGRTKKMKGGGEGAFEKEWGAGRAGVYMTVQPFQPG